MSPLEVLLPEAESTRTVVPFSVRLAERRVRLARRSDPAPSDRRAHARRAAAELEWLRTVRLSGGTSAAITLVDLSEGGALLEVDAPLRPGARLRLEMSGADLEVMVPLEVLRCYVTSLRGASTIYRGACAFGNPIELPSKHLLGAGAAPRFMGVDMALTHLLERTVLGSGGSAVDPQARVALQRAELLQVLDSLCARGRSASDPMSRYTTELLGAILPLLRQGAARRDVSAALESRVQNFPAPIQLRVRPTHASLSALIERCIPDAPLTLANTSPRAFTKAAPGSDAHAAAQKIVVRYATGELVKGFTQDFHPSRTQFSLWPTLNASPGERTIVPLSKLKAIFFVKDFEGNPGYQERRTFTARGQGRPVEVTFLDTEVILGTTLNYRPDSQGFFLSPADPFANNTRIFVLARAVRGVRFLPH
jgi:hypothetical protein